MTPLTIPTLTGMTDAQLSRLYRRWHSRLVRRTGCATWDYPTLRSVAPESGRAYSVISAEIRRRTAQR